jgi:hypothetical protein
MGRQRKFKYDSENPYLKIPDTSKPPSLDGLNDFTIIQLSSDLTPIREFDRITQMARDGIFRKNLLLLRKERNLLIAVQHEQMGNYNSAIICYERARILAERLELFEESTLFKTKVKELSKISRKTDKNRNRIKKKQPISTYTVHELGSKPILPKGVTIPVVNKKIAKTFKNKRTEPPEEDKELF